MSGLWEAYKHLVFYNVLIQVHLVRIQEAGPVKKGSTAFNIGFTPKKIVGRRGRAPSDKVSK